MCPRSARNLVFARKFLPTMLLVASTALVLGTAAYAESPIIQPIESLWFLSIPRATSEADAALAKTLKQWQPTGVFDAALLLKFPPTFVDSQQSNRRISALMKEAGGRFIISTLPVGKEGWESSANQQFAQKLSPAGVQYDPSKAMSQREWLETLKDLDVDTWGWVLEHAARIPTPEEAGRSAAEFARISKTQHKKTAFWMTVEALTHGHEDLMQSISKATRTDADYYVWMDLEAESLRAGESRWQATMGELLDKILMLCPKEKTVIQWINSPRWMAKDVEGTKAYISVCQAKGVSHFAVLMPPQGLLDREPWREFYRTLPKVKPAAK